MKFVSTYKKYFTLKDEFKGYYIKRFNYEGTFHFNLTIKDKPAFFVFDVALMNLVIKLHEKNAALNGIFNSLPGIAGNQYIRNSLVVDVKKTNEIEGVFSTRKEIFELTEDLKKRESNKIGSIVNKYLMLLENKENESIESCEQIRKIYDEMFFDGKQKLVEKNNIPDGKIFRKDTVKVQNEATGEVIHVGVSPEEKIIETLNEAISILHNDDLDIFVRIALFHFIFEYAHPFYDGNGRLGRYLSSLMVKQKISKIFAFRISAGINNFKSDYYKAFEETEDPRNYADLSTFVYSFLVILDKTYDECKKYAMEKDKALTELYEQLKNKHKSLSNNEDRFLFILAQASIFSDFGITVNQIKSTLKISTRTTRRLLETFADLVVSQKIGKAFYYNLKK